MKELTIEQKAQRYDEILARAKGTSMPYYKEDIMSKVKEFVDYLLPELKESEGEKIRKVLIKFFSMGAKNNLHTDGIADKDIIAWLEKQGEYANFRNKIQVGDKVTRNEDGVLVNLSQLKRVAKPNEKQSKQKPNPYRVVSFEYNGHTFSMCARDGGAEILMDGNLKAFISSDKSFVYPIHLQPPYLVPKSAMEVIKEEKIDNQNCVKPTDEVEPMFKVGYWITDGQLTCKVLSATSKSYELHLYNDDYCHFETDVQHVDKKYHLWEVKDAKDGDVLATQGSVFIFKHLDKTGRSLCKSYCEVIDNSGLGLGFEFSINGVYPATKEQRDTLMKAITEAGYKWDANKKELKKIEQKPTDVRTTGYWHVEDVEQKPTDEEMKRLLQTEYEKGRADAIAEMQKEWSEGDEEEFEQLLDILHANGYESSDIFLKSLKNRVQSQTKQKWSEDVEAAIRLLKNIAEEQEKDYCPNNANDLRKAAQYLETCRPQPRWKPSDEQIRVLDLAIRCGINRGTTEETTLVSLFNDLKKLREE